MSPVLAGLPKRMPVGIDIGAGGARLAQLRRHRGRWDLVCARHVPLPGGLDGALGGAVGDDVLDGIARAIAGAVANDPFSGGAVISIDDRALRTRSVRQPVLSDSEREQAVRLDAPMKLGFEANEPCQFGWIHAGQIKQGEEDRDELIYVGASMRMLERLLFALDRVGIPPLAVEPGFVAGVRAVVHELNAAGADAQVRAVVDVGERTTSITLARGERPLFHKTVDFGGRAMTQAAAERLGVEPGEAENIRRQRGLAYVAARGNYAPPDGKVDRALFEAARPLIARLSSEISLCLRHYGTTFRGARPERCVLIGGAALEPKLGELIQETVRVQTEVGRPFRGLDLTHARGDIERRSPGCEWAAAAGLSMWGLRRSRRAWGRWLSGQAEKAGAKASAAPAAVEAAALEAAAA